MSNWWWNQVETLFDQWLVRNKHQRVGLRKSRVGKGWIYVNLFTNHRKVRRKPLITNRELGWEVVRLSKTLEAVSIRGQSWRRWSPSHNLLELVWLVLHQRSKPFMHFIFRRPAPFTQLHSARSMPWSNIEGHANHFPSCMAPVGLGIFSMITKVHDSLSLVL